ncbi:MAG: class I SAM-dependent methyltransferase [Treponemataceae bacterium]
MPNTDKMQQQSIDFGNRLQKWYKHLSKWSKREHISCFRLYDNDIPEIPLLLEIFSEAKTGVLYAQLTLYERPYEKSDEDEKQWLMQMICVASKVLQISEKNFFIKTRKKQQGTNQYTKLHQDIFEIIVNENNLFFKLNLSNYLDTGLFLDMRSLRKEIQILSEGKKVLNLFCYTGSFSVYAAAGKAQTVTSVDLSKKYLNWAKENFMLNRFNPEHREKGELKYRFIEDDIFHFLSRAKKNSYDLIILDPPTFSNSKKTTSVLDIKRDWGILVNKCLEILCEKGSLFFSTNAQKLHFDKTVITNDHAYTIRDITTRTIPNDFRNKKIHRCWKIEKQIPSNH